MTTEPHKMPPSAGVGYVPTWDLPDRLRKARESAGLDQAQLADAMGVGRSTVSNYERALVSPRRIVLKAWALATGVSGPWLETGVAPVLPDEGDSVCAIRDSNPEPAGLEKTAGRGLVIQLRRAA